MPFPLVLKSYEIEHQIIQLFEPDSNVIKASYRQGLIPFPYWSQVWPAAIALARFIINHPQYTRNKTVLELAAGLGLPSIVASNKATSVIASDYMNEAVAVMQQTVEHNQIKNMTVQSLDWDTLPATLTADVLLLSDVSYDDALFAVQEKSDSKFLQKGSVVILTTPQRLIAREAITPLLGFCKYQEEMAAVQNDSTVMISVIVLYNSEFKS